MKKVYFAENLKACRQKLNMSQKELADLLGVNQRTISNWENKISEPKFETLAMLCEILDQSYDELLS